MKNEKPSDSASTPVSSPAVAARKALDEFDAETNEICRKRMEQRQDLARKANAAAEAADSK